MGRLCVSLVNSYQRTTLALPQSSGRVTVDMGLAFWMPGDEAWRTDHIAIIETKARVQATSVDRWLWSRHIRPARVSKYCTCLAVINPELPANRWRPVISRHFHTVGPPRTPAPFYSNE